MKVKILKFSEDQNLLRLGKSQGGSSDDGQVKVRRQSGDSQVKVKIPKVSDKSLSMVDSKLSISSSSTKRVSIPVLSRVSKYQTCRNKFFSAL